MAGFSPPDNRRTATGLGRRGKAGKFGVPWQGNGLSMVVLKEGRRRGPNSEPLVRSFGDARTCAADDCSTQLSRYNPARYCYLHQGWDLEQAIRPRRREPELPAVTR